jgi:uncharacterized membrane-anchored protein YjiN (DUF445 family)
MKYHPSMPSDPSAPSARVVRKQRALDRMRRLTLGLLAASLALLILSVRYQSAWPWLRWLQAFAEASAIGAMADWYAVVALFRRPLGLPIPHTAIIPTHKDSIGESLGEFVAQYLLTPDNIVDKLRQFDTAAQLSGWLAAPANAASVAASLTSFVPGLLRAPDDAELRRFFQHSIGPTLLELDVARLASRLIGVLQESGLAGIAFERGLAAADRWLVANESLVEEKFAQVSRYTPGFLDRYIVRKFLDGMRTLLHDVASDAAHPLRSQFEQTVRELSHELQHSPAQRESARAWMRGVVEAFSNDRDLRRLRDSLAERLEADLARPDSLLRHSAATLIVALAQGVLRDPAIRDRINNAWLRLVRAAAIAHGGQVSTLIAEVVKSWDAREVGRKIELEIGRDLQFIRINGALVGGTVGVLLHAGTLLLHGAA